VPAVNTETVTDHLAMVVPIPPVHSDGGRPRAGARAMRPASDEDEVLLRRLDANELYDIHRGLDWCERELRALGPLRLSRRRHVAALRRRWAHRWHAATGRPAVSLQAHRAWQIAAILAASAALVAVVDGSDQLAAPPDGSVSVVPATVTSPVPTATPTPEPVSTPMLQATGEPRPTGQPGRRVTDRVAQSRARRIARRLERCEQYRQTFLACADAAAPTRKHHVVIGQLTPDGFMLTALARSGNVYTVERVADGPTIRTCTTPDTHGCPRSGRW
jgi:hypothetical protein